MHFSFSAVKENAEENEIPLSAEKKTKVTCAYITELSYGSVANITFSAQSSEIFGTKTKNKTKMKIHFRPKTKKTKMTK